MDEANGTPFGRYQLIELLGRGGMGEVWRAYDSETDRIVALKVLPAHLSEDEEFQRRFRREAHAAARLNSPHVIPIHSDAGGLEGLPRGPVENPLAPGPRGNRLRGRWSSGR